MWQIRVRFDGQSLVFLSNAEKPEEAILEVRSTLNALLKTESANLKIVSVVSVRVTEVGLEK